MAAKDSEVGKKDSTNVLQDVNHINFFDIEYPEIPNDDERVANDLNKGKSDSSSSFESGNNINTVDFLVDSENDADSTSKYSHWIDAMNQEMNALLRNGTWELVELPEGRKAIGSKWIYKIEFRSSVKMVIVRCLLNIDVSMSWPVFQLDVNKLSYMAPRQWNAKLTSTLIENRFSQSKFDYSLYTKSDKGVFLALLVYVDDIIITGKLKYFLGIEVVDTDKGICLNQRKYALDLLSEYGMLACKPAKTPLMSKLVISNKASDKDPLLENITDYQNQFMHSPLTSHLKIAFKILRYLKSCLGLEVHITKTSGMFLAAYSDAVWAKCVVTRKSVTGLRLRGDIEITSLNRWTVDERLRIVAVMLFSIESLGLVFGGTKIHMIVGSIWEEMGQDCNFTRRGLKNFLQTMETASGFLVTPSGFASDGIRTLATASKHSSLNEKP
ncbi:ribonuclease H-like domain-containing protein [Tanacetum coccineum]